MLGVLKFESSLPWEVDADLELELNNETAFLDTVGPKLEILGYKIVSWPLISYILKAF